MTRLLQSIGGKLPLERLKADPRLALAGMALAAAVLALAVVWYLWQGSGEYRPLYGAGESFPAAEAMAVLDAERLPYRLHPQSGQVLVREDQLARARLLLAAKGVRAALPSGYELFDKDEPLGTSQFVQDVRLKRSLEGELARTVMALQGVQQARVHLAVEHNNSFVVGRREPAKASVMVHLAPGYQLQPEQVSAIVNLVAGSVPQLAGGDVKVVDQHGSLLSQDLENGGPRRDWRAVEDYQRQAMRSAEAVLAPLLGQDNYRISVAAEVDFSQREETRQNYGQEPRLRNEVVRDESVLDRLALGVPGSLSNQPPDNLQAARQAAEQAPEGGAADEAGQGGNPAATSSSRETSRQMDYDQSVTHVRHAPHRLQRQSVAVVLNAEMAPEGGWTPAARGEFEAMVKSAVGFDAARGDVFTLSVLPFRAQQPEEQAVLPWWQQDRLLELVKAGIFALVALLLVLLVVRPALRALSRDRQAEAAADEPPPLVAEPERLLGRVAGESATATLLSELNPLSEIRLPAPGSGLEHQIEHLRMLAHHEPERVSEVLKQWVNRHDKDLAAS